MSPAEVISIYGPGIGPPTAATASPVNGFYPKTFAGVQVTINGIDMPLLYVSANQINAVVPMGLATGAAATVRVINGTTVSAGYPVWILESAPPRVSHGPESGRHHQFADESSSKRLDYYVLRHRLSIEFLSSRRRPSRNLRAEPLL